MCIWYTVFVAIFSWLVASFGLLSSCYDFKAPKNVCFIGINWLRIVYVYYLQPKVSRRYRESCGKKIEVWPRRRVRAAVTWPRGRSFHCCLAAANTCFILTVAAVSRAASPVHRCRSTAASRAMQRDPWCSRRWCGRELLVGCRCRDRSLGGHVVAVLVAKGSSSTEDI